MNVIANPFADMILGPATFIDRPKNHLVRIGNVLNYKILCIGLSAQTVLYI